MTRLTISVPDSAKDFIRQKLEKDGYGTVSEYVRELIRRDQRTEAAKAKKEARVAPEAEFVWDRPTGRKHDPFPRE